MQALGRPMVVASLVEGLFARDYRVQYECTGLLALVSMATPSLLYPYFNSLCDALNLADPLLRSDVFRLLCRLEKVDCLNKLATLNRDWAAPSRAYAKVH